MLRSCMLQLSLLLACCGFINGFSSFFTNRMLRHHDYQGDIYDFLGENSSKEVMYGDTANGMFGASVAVWGNRMVVGAPGMHEHSKGSVLVYVRSDTFSPWELEHTFQNEKGRMDDSDQFGCAVDIYENTLVVGADMADGFGEDAGAAFIYELEYHDEPQQHAHSVQGRDMNSGFAAANNHPEGHYEWKLALGITRDEGTSQDYFGSTVAVYGNVTVVGCWGCDPQGTYSGAAYIYTKYYVIQENGVYRMSWGYHQKLVPENGQRYDWFGIDVAVYADIIVVGASGVDDADSLETTVGSAYIYSPVTDDSYGDGINWVPAAQVMAGDGRHNDGFGSAVAACHDVVMVGSPNAYTTTRGSGAIYVFARNAAQEWFLQEKISPYEPVLNGHFGHDLSVDMDIMVVAAFNSSGMGSAHIYGLKTDSVESSLVYWELAYVLAPENEIPGDKFGYSVDVHDNSVVVGAFGASSAWEQDINDDGPEAHHQHELYANGAVYAYTGNARVDIVHPMYQAVDGDSGNSWVDSVSTPSIVVLTMGGLFVALYAYYYQLTRAAKVKLGTNAPPNEDRHSPASTPSRTESFLHSVPFLKNFATSGDNNRPSNSSYQHAPADSEHGGLGASSTALDISERMEHDNSKDYSSELDESLARIAKRQKVGANAEPITSKGSSTPVV